MPIFGLRLSCIIALVSGAIFPLALAPLFWWPIQLLSIAGLAFAFPAASTTRQAFAIGWCYSFGQFATGVSWIYVSIHSFGGTPIWLAVPMVGIFAAFLGLLPAAWFALRQYLTGNTLAWLTLPAFWIMHEWFRSWFFTGFPWLFAGEGHVDTWLSGWAPIIGSYGISFIVVLTVTMTLEALRQRKPLFLLIFSLWPIGLALQNIEWTKVEGTMTVAAVQGNVNQNDKWRREEILPTIEKYQNASKPLLGTDLILWPETAITLFLDQYRPHMKRFADEARDQGSTIITGIPYRHPSGTTLAGEFHNSVTAFGAGSGIYHKQRLVPFGEYVPLEKLIRGWIPFFDLDMSSFLEGEANQPPLLVPIISDDGNEELALIAPFICYEIAYADLVAHNAKEADLLVTVSNDAWFGDSLGPKQHMALVRMRALETQRYILRSTNTGITALVDERGHFVERIPVNAEGILTGVAQRRSGTTPYMLWGIWPTLGLAFFIAIVAMWQRRRLKKL
ncbi:apolipoprotein N-acyltransferase [Thalassolituus sp.]|uniref:apolipoprotein N-acyltransferase n=1 Tax=Thalassolituus sp. TaxID=2030822 RepID=UPI0032D947B4